MTKIYIVSSLKNGGTYFESLSLDAAIEQASVMSRYFGKMIVKHNNEIIWKSF